MEKFMNFLGLNKPVFKFSDFESNLRMHYIINFALDAGLGIFVILFAASSRYWKASAIFLFIVGALIAFHIYGIFQLLGGQVVAFDGVCNDVNKKMTTVLKTQVFGKANIEVSYNDHVYVIPVKHNSPFKKGVGVRVYFLEDSVYEVDEDTYTIPNPIFVTKVKNSAVVNSAKTQEDDKENEG